MSLKTRIYGALAVLVLAGAVAMFGPHFNMGQGPANKCDRLRAHTASVHWWIEKEVGPVTTTWYVNAKEHGSETSSDEAFTRVGKVECQDVVRLKAIPSGLVRLRCQVRVDGRAVNTRHFASRTCNINHKVS